MTSTRPATPREAWTAPPASRPAPIAWPDGQALLDELERHLAPRWAGWDQAGGGASEPDPIAF